MDVRRFLKIAPVAAAIGLVGISISQNAAAYTYAGSKLDLTQLNITVLTDPPAGASVTGFGFGTSTSAGLNGASAGDIDQCGGTIASNTCSAVAPALSSDAANAPGSGITRLNTDYALSGNTVATYGNSNSEIGDAQLSTGNPTSVFQVSEANLTGTGDASGGTQVFSNTNLQFEIQVESGVGIVILEFAAVYQGIADILNAPEAIDANAQFSVSTQASLTAGTGGAGTSNDFYRPSELNTTQSIGPLSDLLTVSVNDVFEHIFEFDCEDPNEVPGNTCTYTLNLQTSTGVIIRQTVPEPGTLALVGAGLLGLALRRRKKA